MEFHNYMEDLVVEIVEEILSQTQGVCGCQQCKVDIAAYALNKLTPKYVVTPKGRVFTRLQEVQLQAKADIIREVVKAIEVIKNNPRH